MTTSVVVVGVVVEGVVGLVEGGWGEGTGMAEDAGMGAAVSIAEVVVLVRLMKRTTGMCVSM